MLQVEILVLTILTSRSQYATGSMHVYKETGPQATPSKRAREEKRRTSETGGMLEQAERKRWSLTVSVYWLLVVSSMHYTVGVL